MTRHVVFHRKQLEGIMAVMKEFEGIVGVDFQYTADEKMDPVRVEYLWEDEN